MGLGTTLCSWKNHGPALEFVTLVGKGNMWGKIKGNGRQCDQCSRIWPLLGRFPSPSRRSYVQVEHTANISPILRAMISTTQTHHLMVEKAATKRGKCSTGTERLCPRRTLRWRS